MNTPYKMDITASCIIRGFHRSAIAFLNLNPTKYEKVREKAGIGGISADGRTFTQIALQHAQYPLLKNMYLSPEHIVQLYIERRIPTLEHLDFWDVPMQHTPIFTAILYVSPNPSADIEYLLDTGYIPTAQDLQRYTLLKGDGEMLAECRRISRKFSTIRGSDIFTDDAYCSYREFFSHLHHCDIANWNVLRSLHTSYNYGSSVNDDTLLASTVGTIPPTHLVEVFEGSSRYLLTLQEAMDKMRNPYTNTQLPEPVSTACLLKREFLWANGYPVDLPQLDVQYPNVATSELTLLSRRLDVSEEDIEESMGDLEEMLYSRGDICAVSDEEILTAYNYLLDTRQIEPVDLHVALEFGI